MSTAQRNGMWALLWFGVGAVGWYQQIRLYHDTSFFPLPAIPWFIAALRLYWYWRAETDAQQDTAATARRQNPDQVWGTLDPDAPPHPPGAAE